MILIIGPPSPGVEYGAHISTLFEQHGEGTQIFLSPSATYDIQTPISLSHDSQQLATLDYPADHTRAVIRTRGASACGITAAGLSHITLRNLSASKHFRATTRSHLLCFQSLTDASQNSVEQKTLARWCLLERQAAMQQRSWTVF